MRNIENIKYERVVICDRTLYDILDNLGLTFSSPIAVGDTIDVKLTEVSTSTFPRQYITITGSDGYTTVKRTPIPFAKAEEIKSVVSSM